MIFLLFCVKTYKHKVCLLHYLDYWLIMTAEYSFILATIMEKKFCENILMFFLVNSTV